MKNLSIIVALDSKNGIWKWWVLAWNIFTDINFFKEITSKVNNNKNINAIIMWHNTWKSIPNKYKPLQNRLNIVLSLKNNLIIPNWVIVCNSLESSFNYILKINNIENIFIIWWAKIYNEAMNFPQLNIIYVTEILWDFNCDTFFPKIDLNKFQKKVEWEWKEENWIKFRFCTYNKI